MSTEAVSDSKRQALDAMQALGLIIEAKFVPFSRSCSKDEKHKSLNWTVTLRQLKPEYRNTNAPLADLSPAHFRDILSTDYGAGIAHCPSYKQGPMSIHQAHIVDRECETGRNQTNNTAIRPDAANVLYSLVMDSSVLDAGSFEEWAGEYGYDTDSRKAESIYHACLAIALKLRNGIGEAGLQQLREAFQDY